MRETCKAGRSRATHMDVLMARSAWMRESGKAPTLPSTHTDVLMARSAWMRESGSPRERVNFVTDLRNTQ
jgi:hypothetical protein